MKLTLKALRMNKGYSQEEAAKLIGVSTDTLANYERGMTYPDVPIINKIEEVYETKYDDINFFYK
jgi:putative transcriptional regulator